MESAMDELAYKLNVDPLQLRIINHSDKNEHSKSNKNG
jgi:xanthine dehydrogenase YagR molybdenum-binding subunit